MSENDRCDFYDVSVPLRGLCFLILTRYCKEYAENEKVSVPLRGLCFLIFARIAKELVINYYSVSVPLRGLCFLIIMDMMIAGLSKMFPSPYGDYVS